MYGFVYAVLSHSQPLRASPINHCLSKLLHDCVWLRGVFDERRIVCYRDFEMYTLLIPLIGTPIRYTKRSACRIMSGFQR